MKALGSQRTANPHRQQPLRAPRPAPPAPRLAVLLPALATAALLWLCHFPVAWGWLAWGALVPLLSLVRTAAPARRVYLGAWVAGLAFFWPVLQWMRVADYRMYVTWAALATYCSFYVPLAVYLLRRLDRQTRLPLIVTLPVVWTALEFLRAHAFTGFAWYFLGHTQHAFLPLIQIADLAGAYGVTFVVAAVNALLFEVLYTRRRFRVLFALPGPARPPGRPALLGQAAAVLLLVGATLVYGFGRLGQEAFTPGPRVTLIQGNLDQRIRNAASAAEEDAAVDQMVIHYRDLCDLAATRQPKPDLIVWPETSFLGTWKEVSGDLPAERVRPSWREEEARSREGFREAAERWQTDVLLGAHALVWQADGRPHSYNSAVLIQAPAGGSGGRYDKIHRVLFGEYVPLRDWLPWMDWFAPYDYDYSVSPGEHLTRFPVSAAAAARPYRFGVIICFEDTDPYLARQYVRSKGGEPAVDFLLNISNDGWFDGTSEHEEHLAICRFRAVECRRAVARAVNMGVSAVIDGSGRVLEPASVQHLGGVQLWEAGGGRLVAFPGPRWARYKKVSALLTAVIPIDRRTSLYAAWGDWLPWGCWLVLGLGLLRAWARSLSHQPLAA